MYTIYANNVCIHNDMIESEALKVLSPSLSMSDSAAGSLSFTILPSNPGYEEIELFSTTITVYKNGEWFWAGRAVSDSKDFYSQRAIECEGVLSFLNDTHQPSWSTGTIRHPLNVFIEHLLSVHNNKVNENRRIYLGRVTVSDGYKQRYTEYETTLESFNDILSDNQGHLMIRYENGKYYLDYLANWNDTNSQEIRFGKNLLDFTTSTSRDNFGTVVYPLGKEDDEGNKLTIETVNAGSPYLQDAEAVSKWGWIEKKFEDGEITSASTLKTVATKVLNNMISEDLTFEISAVDLSMLDNTIEDIRLYDQVRVVSPVHDIDAYYPVSSVDLDLAEPQNDTFTLGEEVNKSLTSRTSTASGGTVDEKGNTVLYGDELLRKSLENASKILNTATNGYVTTVYNDDGTSELIISDNINYRNASKLWRWNINGLGYSSNGGTSYDLAITMDGKINANFIQTGTMTAARIYGDKLMAILGDSYFDLDNSKIHLGQSSGYWVELSYIGKFTAGSGANIYGWIDGSASIRDITTDLVSKGMNIVAPYHPSGMGPSIIRLVSEQISVLASNDSSETSTNCTTGSIQVLTDMETSGDTTTYTWTTLRFINGLLVTALD